ncbi:hypothetical protein ETU08_05445 [Apibacter muscae]|uniref:hypothetical protein n=1 Tax=Apibacter muscae TaxID=2509004 RepID=UPI0011ADDBE9|nr:hypothetical protein [Apibacter muscae]TWP30004.1 hypothetical protein ETU08_05445 [Apibacter muscae]
MSQLLQSQITIGDKDIKPNSSTDLTLTSPNKGFLPNRVSLKSLTDSQTVPNVKEGAVVYNIQETADLGKGLYVWNGTQWDRLLMEYGKKQNYQTLVYKETGPSDVVAFRKMTPNPTEIKALQTSFVAPWDGIIYISTLIYAYASFIDTPTYKYSTVANTFFTITTTEVETGKVTTFYSGCSPVIMYDVEAKVFKGNFPSTASSISTMRVVKDYNYSVKITGIEGWNADMIINAGTYNKNNSSTLKIDFISDPH